MYPWHPPAVKRPRSERSDLSDPQNVTLWQYQKIAVTESKKMEKFGTWNTRQIKWSPCHISLFSGTKPVGTHHPHQSNTNTPHAQSVTLTYTNSTACISTQDQSTATATATATNSSARLRHIHIANTPCHHVTRMLRLFCVNPRPRHLTSGA